MLGALTPRAPSGYSIQTLSQTGRAVPGDGLAILIRNGIPSKTRNLNTNIPAVAIQVRLEQLYTICNIYMPHHQDIPKEQIENLINQLPEPTIIAGDFNAKHTLWGNNTNDRRGHIIENILTQSSLTLLNTGSPTHFHLQTGTHSAIDLTICSAQIPITMEWTVEDDLYGSDHYPVIMNETVATEITREPKFALDRADWPKYYEETYIDPIDELLKLPAIETLVNFFNDHLISAATASIPKSTGRPRPNRVPWWNVACATSNRERKTALRRYQRTGSVTDKISYNRARARAKYIKKEARKNSWKSYVDSINAETPMSKIWSRIRKIRGIYKPINSPILKQQGQLKSDPLQVAEILAEHYESVSSSHRYSDNFKRIQLRKESVGEDQIEYKLIAKSHKTCKQFLLAIFNKIWSSGDYPESWRTGIVLSFHKPGKPPDDPKSYRPITLTSCVGKLLEKMVNTRLVISLEARNLIPEQQFGFRKMKSTIEPLVKITSDILSSFQSKQTTLCVSFDIEKAYDTTWRYGILQALYDFKFRGRLPIYIKNFLANRKFKTKIGKRPFSRTRCAPRQRN